MDRSSMTGSAAAARRRQRPTAPTAGADRRRAGAAVAVLQERVLGSTVRGLISRSTSSRRMRPAERTAPGAAAVAGVEARREGPVMTLPGAAEVAVAAAAAGAAREAVPREAPL